MAYLISMKKAVLVAMLICCSFFCIGCTPAKLPQSNCFILLSIATEQNGEIVQTLQFSVGSEAIRQLGASEEELESFRGALVQQISRFRDEFYIQFMLLYNAKPDPAHQIGKALIVSKPVYTPISDSVGFEIRFTSAATWNYYHGSGNGAAQQGVSGGFVQRIGATGQFPFAGTVELHDGSKITVGERYRQGYLTAATGLPFAAALSAQYYPDFVYDYATPLQALRSDAGYRFTDAQQLFHHTWLKGYHRYLDEDTISLYTIRANRGVWMVTFLGVVLGIAGCLLGWLYWRQRCKKPK